MGHHATTGVLAASTLALKFLLATASCSDVQKISFVNQCNKDIEIQHWNSGVTVPAKSTVDITEQRSRYSIVHADQLQRITWKYKDDPDPLHVDFIELNQDWEGPGHQLCGQVSYSSYASGFSMSSKYESINPTTGQLNACEDPGAAVDYDVSSCPTSPANGYCPSTCTQNVDLCNDPSSHWSRYLLRHSWAINRNGKTTRFYDFNGNYVQYWCKDPERLPGDSKPENVGSWMDCVMHKGLPMIFRITTCIEPVRPFVDNLNSLCRNHPGCPDMAGMCCPAPFGGWLSCCSGAITL